MSQPSAQKNLSKTLSKKIIFSVILGNFLEWYDFSLYGLFAVLLSKHFFPSHNNLLSLMATFSVLAMGYLIRPLGGLLFSHLSDRWGRKKILASTLLTMAFSTAVMGLLPTYQQIGVSAGILLIACRLLQGFALGGEYAGSMVYLVEHAPPHQRGYYGSFVLLGSYMGLLLGSAIGAVAGHILNLSEGAWRIPFLLGSVIGFVGVYIRRNMPETPSFEKLRAEKTIHAFPLHALWHSHKTALFKALGIMLLPAIGSYVTFVYFPNYLTLYTHVSLEKALLINTGTTLVMLISIVIMGKWSDALGKKRMIFLSGLGFLMLSCFLYGVLLKTDHLWKIFLTQAVFSVLVCMCESIAPAVLAELFPTSVRATGISLPTNIGNGFFGGTAPLVITFLAQLTHQPLVPAFYLMIAAFITSTIVLSLGLKEKT